MNERDNNTQISHVSLCTGYGGIDIGLKRAVPNLFTVAFCEIEAFACANLVAKMEAGLMDSAPIWTDIKTFPFASFRGKVDILSGGYPCQPFSAAGRRKGHEDPRHLWPWIADGIIAMQPGCVFFENVEGHVSLGLREVLADLVAIGYRVENDRGEPTWGIFSASEVGAPHQRKRVFILAVRGELADAGPYARCSELWKQQGEYSEVIQGGDQLAYSTDSRRREDRESTELRASLPIQSPGDCREMQENKNEQIWPSRPGEPQYEWEPPRTIAKETRIANRHGKTELWKSKIASATNRVGGGGNGRLPTQATDEARTASNKD